jgi:hypothetical protein
MVQITKLAFVVALLAATTSIASAQMYYGSPYDQRIYMQDSAPQYEPNKAYVGESGGA